MPEQWGEPEWIALFMGAAILVGAYLARHVPVWIHLWKARHDAADIEWDPNLQQWTPNEGNVPERQHRPPEDGLAVYGNDHDLVDRPELFPGMDPEEIAKYSPELYHDLPSDPSLWNQSRFYRKPGETQ